ncbi:hypothetical protein DYB32_002110 [Aphanomyces invadans]|uniref:EamA domain-containing protein n=1 Tax=Aphanomyces invadans TaxID=157072 RepID=A0A3R6VF32_9STRA|nr:hypothetical protein DYB32_002110 [Aphanomyces invadans]
MRRSSGSTSKPPSSAYAVDLRRASKLARISYDELLAGIHTENATRMQGLFLEVDDNDDNNSTLADKRLDALLLTSTHTTAFGVSFGLQELAGKSILEHSLSQLLLAGIERVVVAVAAGSDTQLHLKQSSLFLRMHIVFLEVVPTVLESVPETVLAARHLFASPFLIHAADRVVDQALMKKFDAFHRTHNRVSLLVESDRAVSARMSPSTVFMVLDSILQGVGTLSLAEALAFGFQRVHAMATQANSTDLWFGVDTQDQMVHSIEHDLVHRLSTLPPPTPVSTAPILVKRRASVVLAVEAKGESALPHTNIDMRRPSSRQSDTIEPFQGFVVDVPQLQLPQATPIPPYMQPLVTRDAATRHCVIANEISIARGGSAAGDEYRVAIPISAESAHPTAPLLRRLSPRKSAFLVRQDNGPNPSFLLAVPDGLSDDDDGTKLLANHPIRNTLRRLSALPSDVKEVALEAAVVGGMIDLQLTVRKQVPPIGYAILSGALLSVSSQGAALQALDTVSPLIKMVWRYFGSSVLFGGLAWFNYMDNGLPPALSWTTVRDTMLCSIAYVVFSATFIWALDHTSVGHAYIFSNSHSILLVVGKCMFGHPVAALEAAGALLGIAGGVITSVDHGTKTSTASPTTQHPPTLEGDVVAFVGAIGGVAYLILAKQLKEVLGVWLFCFGLFTLTWILLIPLLWAMHVDMTWNADPVVGFLGWTHHVGTEVLLVVVVSAFGTMGFITSMKYFPPLVVSVTMLLEPIVATVVCIAFGMATTPGWWTFVGGSAVLLGTLLVIISTSSTTEVSNVSDAMVVQAQDVDGRSAPSLQQYGTCSS